MVNKEDCPKENSQKDDYLTDELIQKLKSLVSRNRSPNQIKKELAFNKYSFYKINSLTIKHLDKVWDPNTKTYLDICTYCNCNIKDPSLKINKHGEINFVFETSDIKSNNKARHNTHNTPLTSEDNLFQISSDINKTLDKLVHKIDNIHKFIEDNIPEKKKESTDLLGKILGSENHKKSVNLNKEIEQKVIKYMEAKYGIKNNFSKAINTALFLALYK
ncbi:hypothetical protein [Tepidibacter sp. Z1-5]|uniref:hypothetical protein n=1 Tax=Tepidibacter sp. Z1-5 TaxID=3134138 RepID=UPI0030C42FF0